MKKASILKRNSTLGGATKEMIMFCTDWLFLQFQTVLFNGADFCSGNVLDLNCMKPRLLSVIFLSPPGELLQNALK